MLNIGGKERVRKGSEKSKLLPHASGIGEFLSRKERGMHGHIRSAGNRGGGEKTEKRREVPMLKAYTDRTHLEKRLAQRA